MVDEKKSDTIEISLEPLKKLGKKFNVKNLSNNFWAVATVLLAIVLVVMLIFSPGQISKNAAGQKIVDFAASQSVTAELISVEDFGSLYKVRISVSGQEADTYITKDGKNFISAQGLVPLEDIPSSGSDDDSGHGGMESQYTAEQDAKIQEFSECLASKGFKTYAADWCPHCENMKATFGGDANVDAFWVVCQDINRQSTENSAECAAEGIQGFPTMKLNGHELQVARTFEAIGAAVGCEAPQL